MNNTNKRKFNTLLILGLIVLAAVSRFLPHPPNFTPIGAMALFGAAKFDKKWLAFLIPFLAVWTSNLIFDNIIYAQFTEGFQLFSQPFVLIGFAMITVLGMFSLKKINTSRLLGVSLVASAIFFLLTNFGAWINMPYPKTISGLMAAYAAGIPFFLNTVLGDLFFVAVLFGSYELINSRLPVAEKVKS